MTETVRAGNLITLHYRVATGDDVELISTFGSTPAVLQLGSGELAPTLEHCLIGVHVGERHVFLLEPEQAFGSHNPQLVQRVGLSDLPPAASPELHGLIEFSSP
ncbi:MAG: FKBP-type peptidyl-prolyl cis-trans isomerase, partial [Sulfuritalea sp.]|nr:FKBP-type peptidyl-prolyl cis-trans isomerase [Sulfuritalea sp.]